LVNILILRLCNYDKSPDHVESAGKFTLTKMAFKTHQYYAIYLFVSAVKSNSGSARHVEHRKSNTTSSLSPFVLNPAALESAEQASPAETVKQKTFRCDECSYETTYEKDVQRHKRTHTGKTFIRHKTSLLSKVLNKYIGNLLSSPA
jgi:hypothetical protein